MVWLQDLILQFMTMPTAVPVRIWVDLLHSEKRDLLCHLVDCRRLPQMPGGQKWNSCRVSESLTSHSSQCPQTVLMISLVLMMMMMTPLPMTADANEAAVRITAATVAEESEAFKAGVVYPVELWFLIGSYVSPEDVCTFACVCRYTHVVAHSARFWLGLYHGFCRGSRSLPTSLQSTNVEHRPHGLRTRVIRALFHVYRPLSERVLSHSLSAGTASSRISDPQQLSGLRCILVWQKRSSKSNWKFYFKFRRGSGELDCPLSVGSSVGCSESPRELLAPADVLYNPEERCVILVVSTPHFLPLPVVMGQVLLKASVTGSVFTQSLRLVFSSEYIQPNRSDVAGSVLAHFDPFVAVRILPWCHPNYPHKH